MKNHNSVYFLIAAIVLVCSPAIAKDIIKNSKVNNLVIIVINGVRYNDAFGDKNHLYIDNIWNKLRPLGTTCTKFENSNLTLPIPSQMSLLTGVWHVLENPLDDSIHPSYPTLFEYWNKIQYKTGTPSYFASNMVQFRNLSCSNHNEYGMSLAPVFDYEQVSEEPNAVYEKVMPYIEKNNPSFVYLSLGTGIGGIGSISGIKGVICEPDKKDVCAGDMLNIYYESIIMMDAITIDLVDRLQQLKAYKDKTVFLILSSHGRHTNEFHNFGDKCDGCRKLFLLAIGPGIKKGFVSARKRTLIDICPTVGALFNIPTPYIKGEVMKELLE